MKEIDKLREKIDKVDLEILHLLNKRSEIVKYIGKIKKAKNLFRPARQAFILENLLNNNINKMKPQFILAFWRSIFFSQINIQGGIRILILKNMEHNLITKIYDYFSHDINLIKENSLNNGLERIKREKNTFLVLPYPGKIKYKDWWKKIDSHNFYIIKALPYFLKKNEKPSLVVLSKYKPIIDKNSYVLYTSRRLVNEKSCILEAKVSNYFLYKSIGFIKNKNLKLFGVLPKHYEIRK